MIVLDGNESAAAVAEMRQAARKGGRKMLLQRSALVRLLDRHAAGEMTTDALVDTANELEANEEVDFEEGVERLIATVLFHLATPEMNGDVTPEKVQELRQALTSGDTEALQPTL